MRFTAFFLCAFLAAPSMASAGPVTLGFDEYTCFQGFDPNGRTGPYSYVNHNLFTYGECGPRILLGDDGWRGDFTIEVDEGFAFDLASFDLDSFLRYTSIDWDILTPKGEALLREQIDGFGDIAATLETFQVGVGHELVAPWARMRTPLDTFRVEGFRGATLVDSVLLDADAIGTYTVPGGFTNLTSVRFSLDVALFDPRETAERLYFCDGFNCGYALIDNVTVEARAIAPVPLPAGLPLLAGALGLGAFLARRRSRM